MENLLHITSGDIAGELLEQSGLPGEVLVWHDILYDGPRRPGWPDDEGIHARALFLEQVTAGGLHRRHITATLNNQYKQLEAAATGRRILLWFDACLFDQSMLAHVLSCLLYKHAQRVELLCVDAFPGIEPFHGLGQLQPAQLGSLYGQQKTVTADQFQFALQVDKAFAEQDTALLTEFSQVMDAPLPWVPAAVGRWLEERPDPVTGLGKLENLALEAIRSGCDTPGKVFAAAAAADTPPQFWGDITLWAKINGLAEREPPLVKIEGQTDRLPQWGDGASLDTFKILAL